MSQFTKMQVSVIREDGGTDPDGTERDGQGYIVETMSDLNELPALIERSETAGIPIAMELQTGGSNIKALMDLGFRLHAGGWLRVPLSLADAGLSPE